MQKYLKDINLLHLTHISKDSKIKTNVQFFKSKTNAFIKLAFALYNTFTLCKPWDLIYSYYYLASHYTFY